MKKIFIILLSAAAFYISAEDNIEISVTPSIGFMAGNTSYTLEVPDPVLGIKSYLEFPLNTAVAGIQANFKNSNSSEKSWMMETAFVTNFTNPSGKMEDSDWYLYSGFPAIYFSYTESDAELRFYQADIYFSRELKSSGPLNLYWTAGYRFQQADYSIMGYEGWQYISDGDPDGDGFEEFELHLVSALNSEEVLTYKITQNGGNAGVRFLYDNSRVLFNLALSAQLFWISDTDDHVLRTKLSTAEGLGYGFLASADIIYNFGSKGSRLSPSVFAETEYSYAYADLEQTQTWYGSADSVPAGTTYTGISHVIKTSILTTKAGIKIAF